MKFLPKTLLASLPFLALAACGGGDDLEDRLDVADPVVRFVHADPAASNVSLFRGTELQSDATNVPYQTGTNYFDVDNSAAVWSVKTPDGATTVGTVSIDASRGTKYTIVALQTSATTNGVYLITDPYNKAVTADIAHLRIMNASYNTASVDLYVTAPGGDIAPTAVTPFVGNTLFNTSGPVTGSDSLNIAGGTYQIVVTLAGSKTPIFKGALAFSNNEDILLLTVPDTSLPGGIRVLEKVEGTPGANEIAPAATPLP